MLLSFAAADATSKAHAGDGRIEFRNSLITLSHESQSRPFSCIEFREGSEARAARYRFSLKTEPNYRDAYFILFAPEPPGSEWATLIAYEGYNGHLLGELSKAENGETIEFRHIFHGYYKDSLSIRISQGRARHLSFKKIGPANTLIRSLDCKF